MLSRNTLNEFQSFPSFVSFLFRFYLITDSAHEISHEKITKEKIPLYRLVVTILKHVKQRRAIERFKKNGVPRNQVKRDIIRGGLHEKDTISKDRNSRSYPGFRDKDTCSPVFLHPVKYEEQGEKEE